MRAYTGLLLFENVFEYVPDSEADMVNLANSLFRPNVLVSETDCGTTLGKMEAVNFESQGLVELATGDRMSKERIEELLGEGVYSVATRHTSTCIAKDGVCAKCFAATFPDQPMPEVNHRVIVQPEYLVNAEIVTAKPGAESYGMFTDSNTYHKTYAFVDGFLIPSNQYSIENSVLRLNFEVDENTDIVFRCIKNDTGPFMGWLAKTYSGSVLGMQPLPSQNLPVRSLLLSSAMSENRLQLISEFIHQAGYVPTEYANYADSIKDLLEKALFLLALYSIYSHVTS